MRLSRNFVLAEFTRSSTASLRGIENYPSPRAIQELQSLVSNVLQPLRDYLGRPLFISSGYRSTRLNELVGGVPDSQHVLGQAADIICFDVDTADLFFSIRNSFPFDQLILEQYTGRNARRPGWVHVSYKSDGWNRGMAFRDP